MTAITTHFDALEAQLAQRDKLLSDANWLFQRYVAWGPDENCALAASWLENYKKALAADAKEGKAHD